MNWQKKGKIITPETLGISWMSSYAAVPIVDCIDGDRHRVYFSTRDSEHRSLIGYVEIDITDPKNVLNMSKKPLLTHGSPGTFDDAGCMASWLIRHKNEKWLYYIGWNVGVEVPFRNALGLAVSTDDGCTFMRRSEGPVLDRSIYDPTLIGSACVFQEKNIWHMWYLSGLDWKVQRHKMEPQYNIKYARSRDGIRWSRTGTVCIDFQQADEYAISRPCVIREKEGYKMWYSYRGDHYRIGYAESVDGIRWIRKDDIQGLDVSQSGWDSEMVEYPFVFNHKGTYYMFYNGNGYGKTGIGYAVYEKT